MGKVAFTLDGAAKAASVSKRTIVEAGKAGELTIRTVDGQPVITRADITRWVDTLPSWEFS